MKSVKSAPFHYAWAVLAAGTLVVFGSLGLARFGYTMVLPAMQSGLGLTNTHAGGLATANLIGYLALSVLGGALAARYGPRVVITAGLLVAAAGMLLTGFANSFAAAAAWRALTGIGSGASNVPVIGLLAAWFVQHRRGMAAGIGVTGSSLALIVLGLLVPHVLAAYGPNGWRVCWFIFAGITLGLAILALAILRNCPSDLKLLPIGAPRGSEIVTVKGRELNWGRVYRSGVVWHLGIIYVAFGFSYIIYMTFFTKYLITEGGYSQESAGRLFMLMGWLSLLCGLIWGSFSDKFGRKTTLVIVYIIQAVAFGLFALWPSPPGFVLSASSVRYHGMEYSRDYGCDMRRSARAETCACGSWFYNTLLRRRPGSRSRCRRGYRRRHTFIIPGAVACRRSGAAGSGRFSVPPQFLS